MNPQDYIAQLMAPQQQTPMDLMPLLAMLLMQSQQPQVVEPPSLAIERQGHPLTDIVPPGTPQAPKPATEHVTHPNNENFDVETHYKDVV